jgi:uncharacterized protein with NAD-binding domain and iron-sulfur cluster
MPADSPIKVAIIGGGCAAMAAAFELTRPVHHSRYQVTVYQLGWRLGGKGASGRGAADRIEEHGLHLWMGFYENAFRLMRECYSELGRDPRTCRIATWQDAFSPAPLVALMERARSGDWRHWTALFPPGRGVPGDPLEDGTSPFTVSGYLERSARLLWEVLRSARMPPGQRAFCLGDMPPSAFSPQAPEAAVETIDRFLKLGQLATTTAVLEGARLLRDIFTTLFPHAQRRGTLHEVVLRLLDAMGAVAHRQLDAMVGTDDELRRVWEVADVILSTIRGALRFGLTTDPRGFEAIDDYDWREWLKLNGASDAALSSAFVHGFYDLMFAYEDGDSNRPSVAAGTAIRGFMRMFFTYRGSLFYRMNAGMGDIVFAPLYEVLQRRGVAFRFFHRLRNVRLAPPSPAERPYVAALEFDVQAEVQGGGEYRPLVDVRGLPCWPSRPDYRQLIDGERLEREGWAFESHWEERKAGTRQLHVSRDFDLVILATSVGALPYVASELLARDERWRRMAHEVKTTATQAFQLWMQADMAELGWRNPPINLTGFVDPFDTWADMSHLISEESWRQRPGAIAYFCNVLPEPPAGQSAPGPGFEEAARARVRASAIHFLNHDISALWPRAVRRPGEFRWDLLLDATEGAATRQGEARFDSQFFTANVNPSDRYVLSLPGTTRHRISPLDLTFDNLTIAGDWTASGLNNGCVESAVMSGLLAAHAISGWPRLETIVGYDHP